MTDMTTTTSMQPGTNPALTDDDRWRAVLDRDPRHDGGFVYAVLSTGIFCRPVCPSRRPRRTMVRFFETARDALKAGFRPCRRCRPTGDGPTERRRDRVREVCRIIDAWDGDGVPTLRALAEAVDLSPHHLQRAFSRTTGISPRAYADAVRLDRLKKALKGGEAVAPALYGAGFGSASRLYEQAPGQMGMTPASYARGGAGARIRYAIAEVPPTGTMGRLLVAATERGLCMVALGDTDAGLEQALAGDYPRADIGRDDKGLAPMLASVLAGIDAGDPDPALPLDIRATAFQCRVWRALCAIPRGETRSYGWIAAAIGQPGAARAVGRACAVNPVAVVVPCHRAVAADGRLHGYRWGLERKKTLLEREKRDE